MIRIIHGNLYLSALSAKLLCPDAPAVKLIGHFHIYRKFSVRSSLIVDILPFRFPLQSVSCPLGKCLLPFHILYAAQSALVLHVPAARIFQPLCNRSFLHFPGRVCFHIDRLIFKQLSRAFFFCSFPRLKGIFCCLFQRFNLFIFFVRRSYFIQSASCRTVSARHPGSESHRHRACQHPFFHTIFHKTIPPVITFLYFLS